MEVEKHFEAADSSLHVGSVKLVSSVDVGGLALHCSQRSLEQDCFHEDQWSSAVAVVHLQYSHWLHEDLWNSAVVVVHSQD